MTALGILLAKVDSVVDRSHSEKQSRRDVGAEIADFFSSRNLKDTHLTPLPKARPADDILKDLRNLDFDSDEDFRKLSSEQLFAPVVMLPLAGDYYVDFGGPRPARKLMDLGRGKMKIDTRAIHLTLSGITKPERIWRSKSSDVPQVVRRNN